MISVADIDRWNVADIDAVFAACSSEAQHCEATSARLKNLQTFQTWDGQAADAAKSSVGRTRVDVDAHGKHVGAIAEAANTARAEVEMIKAKLAALRSDASVQGFMIDADGTVRSTVQTVVSAADAALIAARREALQIRVNQLLINAQMVDADLARAIRAADGELSVDDVARSNHSPDYAAVYGIGSLGLPNYPEGSLSNAEARNYYTEAERRLRSLNDELARSGMPLEERAAVASDLRNEIRTKARDLMSDRELAARLYKDEPNASLDDLVERKADKYGMTREQALDDIIRSSSESRGSVNAGLGVDPKNPQLPDPQEVQARAGPRAGPVDPPVSGLAGDAARIAGKLALPGAAAWEAYDGYNQVKSGAETVSEATASGVGAVGEMWAGAEVGASAGIAGGPIGVAAGSVIGGTVGLLLGGNMGKTIGGWLD